jgi:hypothetical protein
VSVCVVVVVVVVVGAGGRRVECVCAGVRVIFFVWVCFEVLAQAHGVTVALVPEYVCMYIYIHPRTEGEISESRIRQGCPS